MTRTHTFRINFSDKEMNMVNALLAHYQSEDYQSLVRLLLGKEYGVIIDTKLRYGKSQSRDKAEAKADRLAERKATFSQMTDYDLTEYLQKVGYIPLPAKLDPLHPSSKTMKEDRIVKDSLGNQQYVQQHYESNDPDKITYSRVVFVNLDEIIKDMIKERIDF